MTERPVEAPGPSAVPVEERALRAGPEPADGRPASRSPRRSRCELLDPEELAGGLEALLFVMDDPVDEETLAGALRCPVEQVRSGAGRAGGGLRRPPRRGSMLRRVGEGWRLYTREEHAAAVERCLVEGQRSRLTQAALETLAVIAYRQPVTRARVSAIRGVGVDGVMRTLLSRGLVHGGGHRPGQHGASTGRRRCSWSGSGLRSLGRPARARAAAARDRRRSWTSTPTADLDACRVAAPQASGTAGLVSDRSPTAPASPCRPERAGRWETGPR